MITLANIPTLPPKHSDKKEIKEKTEGLVKRLGKKREKQGKEREKQEKEREKQEKEWEKQGEKRERVP